MARRISIATGDFTAAGTWGAVDDTSYLDSEVNNVTSTTSFVYTTVFTPGAITVDGIAVKISSRVASPTGTVTVELFNNTDAASVTSVTLNVSDISSSNSGLGYNRGWYFFKFSSSQLLLAATNYKVGVKTSINAEIALYQNTTSGNWSRMLRTTTTGAPAANDQLHIMGEHTGAGAGNSFVITMDNTATTSFGPTVSGGPPEGITVNKRSTLIFGVTAATNYYLKWKGVLGVYDGATLTVGSSGTPMPSDSTAVLEMDAVANIDTGIDINHGAIVSIYGATKTNFKTLMTVSRGGFCSTSGTAVTRFAGSQSFTGLTGTIKINGVDRTISSVTDADNLILTASAGTTTNVIWLHLGTATVVTVADTMGWSNGDELCFAGTTTVSGDCEKKIISTVDSGTQVTLTVALAASHFGTSPMQAEVGNLTRNVKVRGISATLGGYINVASTATATFYYSEFSMMGGVINTGINVATTTGSFDMQYCSRYDSTVSSTVGIKVTSASGNNITLSNNIIYNIGNGGWLNIAVTSGVYTINNNLCILASSTGSTFSDHGITITNNTFVGAVSTSVLLGTDAGAIGTFSGNTIHCNGSNTGLDFQVAFTGAGSTISNTTIWGFSSGIGIRINAFTSGLTIDGLTAFYASTVNLKFNAGVTKVTINNFTANDLIQVSSSEGIQFCVVSGDCDDALLTNCNFSTVSGSKTALLSDLRVFTATGLARITAQNCKFGGATVFTGLTNGTADAGSYLASARHGQVAGAHQTFFPSGIVSLDAVIFDTTPSARLTPNNATNRLKSGSFFAAVLNGETCTPTIKIRESVAGDGTDYNGQRARLFVEKNVAAGIAADTLLATATVASEGAWESLSAATAAVTDNCILSFYVDCGGAGYSAGWVNVDTSSVAISNSTNGFKFWQNGLPVVDLSAGGGSVASESAVTYG